MTYFWKDFWEGFADLFVNGLFAPYDAIKSIRIR